MEVKKNEKTNKYNVKLEMNDIHNMVGAGMELKKKEIKDALTVELGIIKREITVKMDDFDNRMNKMEGKIDKVLVALQGDKETNTPSILEGHKELLDFKNKLEPYVEDIITISEEQKGRKWITKNWKYFLVGALAIIITILSLIAERIIK